MNFALTGWHPALRPLLMAIAESDGHSLSFAALIPPAIQTELKQWFPAVRFASDWESLLSESQLNAVIVAGTSEEVRAGAKQLATAGTPVALLPDAAQKSSFIYELGLIRDDNHVALVPLPSRRLHPLVAELRRSLRTADATSSAAFDETGGATLPNIGMPTLFRLERTVEAGDGVPRLNREQIDEALLDDVLLLRDLGGSYDRVTAIESGTSDSGISQSTITLAGAGLPEATWTARPGGGEWKLTISATNGSAVLSLSESIARLEILRPDQPLFFLEHSVEEPLAAMALGRAQLAFVAEAVRAAEGVPWAELTRAFETVEATHASLRRRRTVELFFETTSERSIFKSQMTAAGCGLLMLTLFLLVGFLLLGAMLDSRSMGQRRAEAERRILTTSAFEPASPKLSTSGKAQLSELIATLGRAPQPILITPEEEAALPELDQSRIDAVAAFCTAEGHPEYAPWLSFAEVPHPAAQLLLKVLRVLWIVPLVIFLALQSLLAVARPSAREQGADTK